MNLLLQSFSEEKLGEWMDHVHDCEACVTACKFILCVINLIDYMIDHLLYNCDFMFYVYTVELMMMN